MDAFDLQALVTDFSELPADRDRLLNALPAFLVRHFGGAGVVSTQQDGKLVVLTSSDPVFEPGSAAPDSLVAVEAMESGECARLDESSALPDLPQTAVWPIFERTVPIACLHVYRSEAFSNASFATLEVFARLISSRLTDSSLTVEATILAELVTALGSSESVSAGAEAALKVLTRYAQADAGYILHPAGGVMQIIASVGQTPTAERARILGIGQPFPIGLAWDAVQTGEGQEVSPQFEGAGPGGAGRTAVVPLGWRDTFRFVLIMRYLPRKTLTPSDLSMFQSIGNQLQLGLERLQVDLVQDRLLRLQAKVGDLKDADLYQLILEEAVQLVPGADAGSILSRTSGQPFTFRAAIGFDMEALQHAELSEANMMKWYAKGESAWQAGEPRELSLREQDVARFSAESSDSDGGLPGTEKIRATICLPVSFRGEVLAFLNLDNLNMNNAFGADSVKVLKQFAPVVSNLLGSARQLDVIRGIANTDVLTGLYNRRAGDEALKKMLTSSSHSNEPFVVLSVDMNGFKFINDMYGHDAGDKALMRVAGALTSAARSGDTVARWGGDEFLVLLPGADRATGVQVAERLREAVSLITVGDTSLRIAVGEAVFPEDGTTAAELLQAADERMYRQKAALARGRAPDADGV